LVAGLVLGGTGSVLAQGPPNKRGLFGTVSSVDTITSGEEYLISLETELGIVDVTINGTGTKYMVPKETRGPKDLATFLGVVDENDDDNLEELVDRRMAVLVKDITEDGNPPDFTATAIRLMLIPSPSAPPSHTHRVGIVDAFTEDASITIIDKDGESHTFTLNETVYRPDGISELTGEELIEAIIGGFVTVVTKGDPKLPDPIAKAIVLHEDLPDWAPEP
jgi:hypothetical protein